MGTPFSCLKSHPLGDDRQGYDQMVAKAISENGATTPEQILAANIEVAQIMLGDLKAERKGIANKIFLQAKEGKFSIDWQGIDSGEDASIPFSRKQKEQSIPEAIEVDNKSRPTRNSNGKLIAGDEKSIANFWKWFSDSKVVDSDGKPLVVYHGTASDISEFDSTKNSQIEGMFFTPSTEYANQFAKGRSGSGNVLPVYLALVNPRIIKIADYNIDSLSAAATDGNADGILVKNLDGSIEIAVAFTPNQIKSATGNQGTFDGTNPNIQFSRQKENESIGKKEVINKSKLDEKYLSLIESGNLEEAQKLVDKAALDAGYITANDYRMNHQAPNSKDDVSILNIRESGLVPDGYWTHPHWYQSTPEERESFSKVQTMLRRIDIRKEEGKSLDDVGMRVYRAVPKDIKDGSIRNGDWVSPSKYYAKMEGAPIPEGYKIISQWVRAKDLYFDGNSMSELGVDDGKAYAYKNTKNNKKLIDVVTYDYDGKIIPLSKRFNSRKSEVQFSRKQKDYEQTSQKAIEDYNAYHQVESKKDSTPDEIFSASIAMVDSLDAHAKSIATMLKEGKSFYAENANGTKYIINKSAKEDGLYQITYLDSNDNPVSDTEHGKAQEAAEKFLYDSDPRTVKEYKSDDINKLANDLNSIDKELDDLKKANLLAAWRVIAESPDTFRHAKGTEKTLDGLMGEYGIGDYEIKKETIGKKDETTIYARNDTPVIITHDKSDNAVWINAAFMKEGNNEGDVFYQLVADYAANNGYTFIGDPAGLSDSAIRRRTEQMLASALKHDSTDHLMPHERQMDLTKDEQKALGVTNLDWIPFDTDHNINELLRVSNSNIIDRVSYAKYLRYNLESGKYFLKDKELSNAEFIKLSQKPKARAANAGITTLKRTAITNSILSGEMGANGGLDIREYRNLAKRGIDNATGSAGVDRFAGISYSRKRTTGDNNRVRTPEQIAAFENVGRTTIEPTLKERFSELTKDFGKKMAQGIVDQFAPVKDMSATAYNLLRLSKGASGAFEVFLRGGKLKLDAGVYDFDETQKGGVVEKLLMPLQTESDDFFWWIAGNRAEKLAMQGKERLFSQSDIVAFKSLNKGDTDFDYTIQNGTNKGQVTRNRKEIYADSLITFNDFNKNILDLTEKSGLIDGESRAMWESEFYVPFYRVSEESSDGVRGANVKSGIVRQKAFEKLKGGEGKLNNDLLENTLMNWAHLLDASAKNRAAKATLQAATFLGAAQEVSAQEKNAVWYMDGKDKKFFTIDDPYLLTAINGLEYAGMRNPMMNAMGTMKHALTMGVTASPFFKVRNLMRDSVQAIALSGLSSNPAKNIKDGWKLTNQKSDEYFRLLAGGGTIHFGAMLEGSESKRVRSLVNSGVDKGTILNSEDAIKNFYGKVIKPSLDWYNEIGNRGEAINRAALYDQMRKSGKTHAEASLLARDLMDFSMQGSFTSIRFLTQIVPFMNARLQGMYKLGKSAKEDPKKFGAVLGAVAIASIALMLAYKDDDDWKAREEWDRDNFWWFKIGGIAYRIPKPFEIGAIGTVAERGIELFASDEMNGTRFKNRMLDLVSQNLSMNPIPQIFKPILDVYANKDAFSGRPIETMSMERLQSEYRFNGSTSMVARGVSTTGNAVTNGHFLSPVQIDSMIRGYFGWLGTMVVSASDKIAKPATGQKPAATPDYLKLATGNMLSDVSSGSSRYVSKMYDQARVVDEAYGTWQMLQKTGQAKEAQEFADDNKELLRNRGISQKFKNSVSKINEQIRVIERSNLTSDEKKEKLDKLKAIKNDIAKKLSF
jgi:hypothetical protein